MKHLRIPDDHVDRAVHLIDTARTVEHIDNLLANAPQGRPRRVPIRTLLIGYYLGIECAGSFKSTTCFNVLRTGISIEKQTELGTRWTTASGKTGRIKKSHVNYFAKRLHQRGYYTEIERASRDEADRVSDAELARRSLALQALIDDLLSASIVDDVGTGWYAVDGTGIWAQGRSSQRFGIADDARAETEDQDAATEGEVSDGQPEPDETGPAASTGPTGRRVHREVEATIGRKTAKSGGKEFYTGYVVDAAVRVPRPGEPTIPIVLEALSISPASTDVVAPTLMMIDSLNRRGQQVTDILGDRLYSHKAVGRWADELRLRGIWQHLDLRSDDQKPSDFDGILINAGRGYCPSLPEELYDIPSPGLRATPEARRNFNGLIDKRQTYALTIHERPNVSGRAILQCPAVSGKVGCALRPETVEPFESAGLPVIRHAQTPTSLPRCCTADSGRITVRSDRLNKLFQPHAWGTKDWTLAYNRRTYVEGFFGSIKNPDTENLDRGQSKFTGLVRNILRVAMSSAACNIRHQAKFYEGSRDHPLLNVEDDDEGWSSAATRPDTEPRQHASGRG